MKHVLLKNVRHNVSDNLTDKINTLTNKMQIK